MKELVIFGILKDRIKVTNLQSKYHVVSAEIYATLIYVNENLDIVTSFNNQAIQKEKFVYDYETYKACKYFLEKYVFDRDYNYYIVEFGTLQHILEQVEEMKLLQEII